MKTNAGILRHVWAAALFLVLFSCKKSMIQDQTDLPLGSTKTAGTKTLTTPIVYAAGAQNNQAVYWKDDGTGVATTVLSGGNEANGIQVVGADVHVCGIAEDPVTFDMKAMYWLNGTAVTLPNSLGGDSWTTGITVTPSGDVYISGCIGPRYTPTAVYWLNGIQHTMYGGKAGPITVTSNGDVYAPDRNFKAYMKNGAQYLLNTIPVYWQYYAHGLAVDASSNIHVVGSAHVSFNSAAMYWLNSSPVQLSSTGYYVAVDVAVDPAGHSHISGWSGDGNSRVGVWFNGLPGFAQWGTKAFYGNPRIELNGYDVYVCGGEADDASHVNAKYWMNGNVFNLTTNAASAYANDIDLVQ
jgi:hypothetical protein